MTLTPKEQKTGKASLVPRPCPAFRRFQYRYRFTVLQVTESWAGPELARVNEIINLGTVRTRVTPSFRVRVRVWYIHEPKLPLGGRIYMLTVGSVLTTNVSQTSLCQLSVRATIKIRLHSCLSLLLEWTTLTPPKSLHI